MQSLSPLRRLIGFILFFTAAVSGQAQKAAGAEQFDGPAELPREYVKSSMEETPAPGKATLVKNRETLATAIDTESCGEQNRLQEGDHAVLRGDRVAPGTSCFPLSSSQERHGEDRVRQQG